MSPKKLRFEIKKLELMIEKLENSKSVTKCSVLSDAVERGGFWFIEAEIPPKLMVRVLMTYKDHLNRVLESSYEIQRA